MRSHLFSGVKQSALVRSRVRKCVSRKGLSADAKSDRTPFYTKNLATEQLKQGDAIAQQAVVRNVQVVVRSQQAVVTTR